MEKTINKRETSAHKTKLKLAAAAHELLKEGGFETISVEDITKKAGVAKGTFYIYFKRKEDIIAEIGKAPFEEIAIMLEKMEEIDVIEKLTFYFHHFMECVEYCGINICREWIKNVINPNQASNNVDKSKWSYDVNMLYGILKKAVNSGELAKNTPIELFVHILICELYGMMTCWCMSSGKFEPLEWTEKFSKIQLEKLFGEYVKSADDITN